MKIIKRIKGESNGRRVVGLIGKEFAIDPYYVGASVIVGRGKSNCLCCGSFKTLEQAVAFAAKWGLQ